VKTISSTRNWDQKGFVGVRLMHGRGLRSFVMICLEIIGDVSIMGGG
jgi:hypothetical protein